MKPSHMQRAAWLALGLASAAQAQSLQPGLWEIQQDIRTPGRPEVAAQMAQAVDFAALNLVRSRARAAVRDRLGHARIPVPPCQWGLALDQ